ncbi:MAG: anti-sigma factor [Burkholderiaceae bacterium]
MNEQLVTEGELHAYADRLLPEQRAAEIEAYLAVRQDEARRVSVYRAQNAALRVLYDPVLDEPVPTGMTMAPRALFGHLQRYAAGLMIACASGAAGWFLHTPGDQGARLARGASAESMPPQASAFAHQAAIAHVVYSPEVRHPVEVGADQEAHLVAWLSKRLGTPVHPPRLAKLGYELVGGRLLPGQSGPVAQFMYHDAGGQRLTLYVSTEQSQNKNTGFRFSEQGPVNVFYWIDGAFGYALSGSVDRATLAHLADAVYAQLDKPAH